MTTNNVPTLLPCPFCGGKASFERLGTHRQSAIVVCDSCGCRHESGYEHEQSAYGWNTRQPAMPADTALLDYLSSDECSGSALVTDDAGRWALTDGGIAPVPEEGGFTDTVGITAIVDPDMWQDSPREAIAYARRRIEGES